MPRLIRVAAVASLAVVILVCGTSPESACGSEARSAVETFIAAMNTGDPEVAAGVFADGGFSWFSEAPYRVDPEARRRDTLAGYLAERITTGARYELASFDFNSYDEARDLGNFGLVLTNGADQQVNGKGAVDCGTGKIVAMSLGKPH